MNLQYRIDLLSRLGEYILSESAGWKQAKEKAGYENGWFIAEFVDMASNNIANSFLKKEVLEEWARKSEVQSQQAERKKIGIIMAGNIPLVGFHDLLSVFISGHHAIIKASSRDNVLIKHLVAKLASYDEKVNQFIQFSEMLKGCDAYITTGSNNSSRYFEYYFGKYPHIIRRNRTSVAVLTGKESKEELERLADDVYLYFGLGCRNVTKIYVPSGYDFVLLLEAFRKYNYLADHHKYKNNYDYNLAIHILNNKYYMTNGSLLLIEDPSVFSPISQLNYEFYSSDEQLKEMLKKNATEIQCIAGQGGLPFGTTQRPAVTDYADGINTIEFLTGL
jgi:hypothetical protein